MKHTLKIFQCEHCKVVKVCLTIYHHYALKSGLIVDKAAAIRQLMKSSGPLKKIGGISVKSFCRFSEKGKHYHCTVVSLLLHDFLQQEQELE